MSRSGTATASWKAGPWGEKPEALHVCLLPKVVKKADLVKDLDEWRREELPAAISARKPPHATHDELKKLMQHKLSKFKFRPGLQKYVDELDPKVVVATTTRALAALHSTGAEKGAREALKILCELKGIGPATASSLLSAIAPDRVAYTSDEALAVTLAAGPGSPYKPRYTADEVWALAAALRPVADSLSASGSTFASGSGSSGPAVRWTIEDVQRALWARLKAEAQGVPLPLPTEEAEEVSAGAAAAMGGAGGPGPARSGSAAPSTSRKAKADSTVRSSSPAPAARVPVGEKRKRPTVSDTADGGDNIAAGAKTEPGATSSRRKRPSPE